MKKQTTKKKEVRVFPFPNKVLKNNSDIEEHLSWIYYNALQWLNLAGYITYFVFPGDKEHTNHEGAGLSIRVEYPYKKIKISVQQDSIDKMLATTDLKHALWGNIERSMFHEVIHIITWRLGELSRERYVTPTDIQNEDEFVVDHLTNCLYNLVKDYRMKGE